MLTKNKIESIEKLIRHLKEGSYVFIIGPNGMGKTAMLKKAEPLIKKEINPNCYYFDMKEDTKEGAFIFYNKILQMISGKKEKFDLSRDLSNDFIEHLGKSVLHPTVLIFDGFHALTPDFYDHFSFCREGRETEFKGS